MADERKVPMQLADGRTVEGVEVPVDESTERWSEIKLQDGTVLRVKLSVLSALRAVNEHDPLGQPWYSLNMTPVIAIVEIPEKLKKPRH